ncbi:MAG: discoidin domain-containing protein [Clostridium sp.]|uniref:discoidin domain-containing protein n=1 Tax=Clostridium sp. TaxID=1506 RepID=UPI002A915856|nr:discoidin domain-containing protein [Clostridium sp.]MDY6228939.1 discoidin domain-containing protein [Clostridium sp.]
MKKKGIYKGLATLLSICIGLTVGFPLNATKVQAAENLVIQPSNEVSLSSNGNIYTFGNDLIKRSFSVADGKLKTENITNYRTNGSATVLTPTAGSEEFVINTLDNGNTEASIIRATEKLTNNGWTIESDSVATNEGVNGGSADKMFDNNNNTYYHSKYINASENELKYPHNIYVDLKEVKNIKSIRYQQRVDANGNPTVSGHVKSFKIYAADTMENLRRATTPAYTGTFQDIKENYINLDGNGVTTQFIRIEFTEGYDPSDINVNKNVACCSEFDFYEDKTVNLGTTFTKITSSALYLKGEPIEKDIENGKTLTFQFKPVTVRGVEYTINEVITMYHGESFMRKHLEISVPEGKADKAKIDYIDLENMNINSNDLKTNEYWTIPEQSNNAWMAGMKGDYLELGQPFYLSAMYFGCEFPQTENKIRNNNGFIRYHYGKSLAKDTKFEYNDNNVAGKMTTWPAVVGSARSKEYNVVQSDFYEYIETIAVETNFRQQYNSWFDHMKDISAQNIKQSFYEVEKGFTQHGVDPLDSYVVDDGWVNYSSFWGFNNKFPNQLYDSSLQVEQLGSNFGLWLGPRGGYGTQTTIANWIANNNLGSVNAQSGNDINISDARYVNKLLNDVFLNYQDKFNINYWKLDGMLLNPAIQASDYYVTGKPEYTITETYERWTDMYEKMREQRGGKDLWINMTSYVNPSPWYLQWVNSVWMQNTADVDFTNKYNSTDEQQMLTYRDNSYYEFVKERQWQLPFKYFYNHDPVYGNRTHEGKNRSPISFTDSELREYLYMLGTRGTAFWEYYYSYNMFDDDKWDINAEAANWIEDNFDILQKSKMIGGKPNNGDIYGYSCWNNNEGIVSLRNPSDLEKTITITYDRLIGVNEGTDNLYGKVVIGDVSKYQNDEVMKYGKSVTYTLKPKETLIMQYGAKDTQSATIDSVHADGRVLEVEFNETIRTPENNTISVEGNSVESMVLKEDLRTVKVTLTNEIPDTSNFKVVVNGIKDIAGNVTNTEAIDDYYKNGFVTSIVNKNLNGIAINKGSDYSIDGKEGFSIAGIIKTDSKNAQIVRQEGSYVLSIDNDGYLNFSLNGVTVNSKYTEKTIVNGEVNESVKGLIADGKEHQFVAVKEINGMLKLYIDGSLVASEFDKTKANPVIEKNNVIFGDNLTGYANYVTVVDYAMAFDKVKDLAPSYENIVARSNNSSVVVSAYDVTKSQVVAEKTDRPFSHINDGNKSYTSNYMELTDTADRTCHSRYVQIDLGAEYEIDKLNMIRYVDGRTYGPTVITLSNDVNFATKNIVYNSDTTGTVHNLGVGSDTLYVETAAGKDIKLSNPVKARYIRIYVNGNQNGATSDHIVEFEAYAKNTAKVNSFYRNE